MKRFLAPRTFGVLTEGGKRASAAFDPIEDDPAIKCDPGSPVRFWINVNEPFEIKREADSPTGLGIPKIRAERRTAEFRRARRSQGQMDANRNIEFLG